MSTGPRISLAAAREAARILMEAWGMAPPACVLVGSARRSSPTVGDLEIIAPHEPASDDRLFDRLQATLIDGEPALFGPGQSPTAPRRFARAVKGHRRGFWQCDLAVRLAGLNPAVPDEEHIVPVQIFRYDPSETMSNRGWIEAMRTGPQEFNIHFLSAWKRALRIPAGRPASQDGWLLDSHGRSMNTPDESTIFRIANLPFIAPEHRAHWAQQQSAIDARSRREALR